MKKIILSTLICSLTLTVPTFAAKDYNKDLIEATSRCFRGTGQLKKNIWVTKSILNNPKKLKLIRWEIIQEAFVKAAWRREIAQLYIENNQVLKMITPPAFNEAFKKSVECANFFVIRFFLENKEIFKKIDPKNIKDVFIFLSEKSSPINENSSLSIYCKVIELFLADKDVLEIITLRINEALVWASKHYIFQLSRNSRLKGKQTVELLLKNKKALEKITPRGIVRAFRKLYHEVPANIIIQRLEKIVDIMGETNPEDCASIIRELNLMIERGLDHNIRINTREFYQEEPDSLAQMFTPIDTEKKQKLAISEKGTSNESSQEIEGLTRELTEINLLDEISGIQDAIETILSISRKNNVFNDRDLEKKIVKTYQDLVNLREKLLTKGLEKLKLTEDEVDEELTEVNYWEKADKDFEELELKFNENQSILEKVPNG